jgi:SMC interacting uncharacterized protein involved in chromosome segregation
MSDANKFVNTYIDIAVNTIHRYVTDELKLKTEVKLANDLIQEKNGIISGLQEKLNKNNISESEIAKFKANSDAWENQYNAMKNKVSHMDTITNQLVEMKKIIQEKDNEISRLKTDLNALQEQIYNQNQMPEVEKYISNEEGNDLHHLILVSEDDINKITKPSNADDF